MLFRLQSVVQYQLACKTTAISPCSSITGYHLITDVSVMWPRYWSCWYYSCGVEWGLGSHALLCLGFHLWHAHFETMAQVHWVNPDILLSLVSLNIFNIQTYTDIYFTYMTYVLPNKEKRNWICSVFDGQKKLYHLAPVMYLDEMQSTNWVPASIC